MQPLARAAMLPLACAVLMAGVLSTMSPRAGVHAAGPEAPRFEVDPMWPKPLPHHWILGMVVGVGIDAQDHIWIVHRQPLLEYWETYAAQQPPLAECCAPAPPVLEFDEDGNLINSWGGPGQGYDGSNQKIHILDRQTMQVLTSFGDGGRQPGEFYAVHSIATDSKGNLFTTETYRGQRVQKFLYKGLAPVTTVDQGVVWPKVARSALGK